MEGYQQDEWTSKEPTVVRVTSAITKDELLQDLTTRVFGRNLFVFAEIDSTNICAASLADTGAAEGTVVWADFQTAGKGRQGRSWTSEPGLNLAFSIILKGFSPADVHWYPYYVSEAVAGGVEQCVDVHVRAKWPNDLLLEDRKFSGILLERTGSPEEPSLVAGIGINVNQVHFPPDLEHSATSLHLHTGSSVDRLKLYRSILENLEALVDEVRSHRGAAIIDAWRDRCMTFGREIEVRSGAGLLRGRAIGLGNDGGLILETREGLKTVHAGDVSIVPRILRT